MYERDEVRLAIAMRGSVRRKQNFSAGSKRNFGALANLAVAARHGQHCDLWHAIEGLQISAAAP